MLSGQFDINSDKYYVILILLLLSFSSVSFKNLFSSIEPYESFIIFLVVLMIYFLFQSDVNIFKIGNSIFITVITFLVNGYIVDPFFQEIGQKANINFKHYRDALDIIPIGGGVVVFDYNNDGFQDVYIASTPDIGK